MCLIHLTQIFHDNFSANLYSKIIMKYSSHATFSNSSFFNLAFISAMLIKYTAPVVNAAHIAAMLTKNPTLAVNAALVTTMLIKYPISRLWSLYRWKVMDASSRRKSRTCMRMSFELNFYFRLPIV